MQKVTSLTLYSRATTTIAVRLRFCKVSITPLRQAAKGDILGVSLDIVVAYGNPTRGDAITTDILVGVEFTEDNTEWKQGDKFQEKTIPFVFLDKKSV